MKFFRSYFFPITIAVGCVLIALVTFLFLDRHQNDGANIAMILPLTGNQAVFGEWIQNGVVLALTNLEQENPNIKDLIRISTEDSQGEAKEGINAFNKVIATGKPDAIICAMTRVAIPLIPLTETREIPLLLQDVTFPGITLRGNRVFRHFIQSDREAKILSSYLKGDTAVNTVSILYVNDEAGVGAATAFEEDFKLYGTIVSKDAYEVTETDLRPQVTKILSSSSDAVFLFGNGPSWANALRTLKELGFKGKILTNAALYIPNFRKIAGDSAAVNVVCTFPYIDTTVSSAKHFVESYIATYNTYPPIEAAYAYDLVNLLIAAVRQNNSLTLVENLSRLRKFDGAFGVTFMETNRDFVTPIALSVYDGTSFRILKIINPQDLGVLNR